MAAGAQALVASRNVALVAALAAAMPDVVLQVVPGAAAAIKVLAAAARHDVATVIVLDGRRAVIAPRACLGLVPHLPTRCAVFVTGDRRRYSRFMDLLEAAAIPCWATEGSTSPVKAAKTCRSLVEALAKR